MENKQVTLNYAEGDNINELSIENQELANAAIAFSDHAYAPYSNFHVAACLRLDDNQIIKGANVENGSYPVSICAERTLLAHTVANYPDRTIKSMAIYVDKSVGAPVSPCGMCRQTLLEVELRQKSPIELILISKEGSYIVFKRVADLLPLYFDGSLL